MQIFRIPIEEGFVDIPAATGTPDFTPWTEPRLAVIKAAYEQAVVENTIEVVEETDPPLPPPDPDWNNFNTQMLARTDFNTVIGSVLQQAPVVAMGLPAALAQVSTNGTAAFSLVYGGVCQIGGATDNMRAEWKEIAVACNLPQEFINVI